MDGEYPRDRVETWWWVYDSGDDWAVWTVAGYECVPAERQAVLSEGDVDFGGDVFDGCCGCGDSSLLDHI